MKGWIARAPRAFGVALVFVGISGAQADTVGAMKQVVQTVYGTPPQGQQHPKRIGDPVVHNELFETWKESRALVEFIDGSHLTVGANSKVLIDSFVFDPAKSQGNALIDITAGTLRFVTGQMPHGGTVIRTPTATLTLRGTDVTVRVHPGGTTDTTVSDGKVDVQSNADNQTTTIGPGEGTTSGEGGNRAFDGEIGDGGIGGNVRQAEHRSNSNNSHDDFASHEVPAASHDDGDSGGDDGGDCGCI